MGKRWRPWTSGNGCLSPSCQGGAPRSLLPHYAAYGPKRVEQLLVDSENPPDGRYDDWDFDSGSSGTSPRT